MSKKHLIHTDGHGNATGNSEVRAKRKPQKPYVQAEWITEYMKARDRLIYKEADEETKRKILERWTK